MITTRSARNEGIYGARLGAMIASTCYLLYATFCLSSCNRSDPLQAANNDVRKGEYLKAASEYEDAMAQGNKPAIHLKLAELFAVKLRDPASAAYHYHRVIVLDPVGKYGEIAREHLKKGSVASFASHTRLPTSVSATVAAGVHSAKTKTRVYQVQSGETLQSISRKIYGTPNRWKDLLDANMTQIRTPSELKPGQTIILP
jgi:nucleoid-associated protein YgaU